MLCELWALLSRILGPKPKSTAGLGHTGDGVCTMDPDICHWVRQFIGIGDKPRSIPMRLRDLVTVLLPRQAHLLAGSHTAGADAHMHLLIACELQRRAHS